MPLVDLVGYAAAFFTTAAFFPQALRVVRTRQTRDISLSMYVIFTLGVALWLSYGIALGNIPMMAANSVTLLLAGVVLGMKLRYG